MALPHGPFVDVAEGAPPGSAPDLDATWFNDVETAIAALGTATAAVPGSRIKYVAASNEPAPVRASIVAAGGYECDGTADEVQINAALAAVGSTTINRGNNGGHVVLVGRQFNIAAPILQTSQTKLSGLYGKYATIVTAASPFTTTEDGGMVQMASPDAQYTEICDITLNGAGRTVGGIYYNVGAAQEWDVFNTAHDLYILDVGHHGIYTRGAAGTNTRNRGSMYDRIRIINPGKYGVWTAAPDAFYHMIDVGSSGSHGFNIAHSNNRYMNCKAWYSDGHGFNISGGRDNQLAACESQDNEMHGYYINSAMTTLVSCCADSNSYSGGTTGSNTYDGFNVVGGGTNLQGTATDKNEGGRGYRQRYGVNVSNAAQVIINVTARNNVSGGLNGTGAAGSSVNVISF